MDMCEEMYRGFRTEDRSPVGIPRGTWLESVEADVEDFDFGKEDVHDRNKWRRNVKKRTSYPISQTINL